MRSSSDQLTATTSREGATIILTCSGSAETDALSQLRVVLSTLHEEALRTSTREVVADIRALEFATSSCLKELVTWLMRIIELDDDRRYQVRFRSNPRHSWQRRSLGALAAFAGNVVQIETEPS